MGKWVALRTRQLTGQPKRYHGYVGWSTHNSPALRCHNGYHRSEQAAIKCAEKHAARLNKSY